MKNNNTKNMAEMVELVFENMEFMRIPSEYLVYFEIDDIRTCEDTLSCNTALKHVSAEQVRFEILDTFKPDSARYSDRFEICEDYVQRLFQNDIAYLRMHRADGTYEDVFVPWQECEDVDNTDCQNRLQHVTVGEAGRISVRIG